MVEETATEDLLKTPLYDFHVKLGGKMVPFAGYLMPVQYPLGIMKEHQHCREKCGLFDVSHMGQVVVSGKAPEESIEALLPGDIQALEPGQIRYTQLTTDLGGIIDDLMVTRRSDDLFVVVNASRKDIDIARLKSGLGAENVEVLTDRALIALQGPLAEEILGALSSEAKGMKFMTARPMTINGIYCEVSRSGYTGEDGYEISVPADRAMKLAATLLKDDRVEPIGLGARDSLRLEAGLCLYGNDIDESTSPVEAGLLWSISKRRREEGGFPGFEVIRDQITNGPPKKRVGILPSGRAPAREGTEIQNMDGKRIGVVTSGGFGPTKGGPVAMGYVQADYAAVDTEVNLIIRGKLQTAKIAKMPFVTKNFKR